MYNNWISICLVITLLSLFTPQPNICDPIKAIYLEGRSVIRDIGSERRLKGSKMTLGTFLIRWQIATHPQTRGWCEKTGPGVVRARAFLNARAGFLQYFM